MKFLLWLMCYLEVYFLIYWDDTGSENHTGFLYTTKQNIICTLHRAPITQSKTSFLSSLSPLCHPPATSIHLSLWLSPQLFVSICYVCVCCLIFSPFIQALNSPFWQLSVCSMYPCHYFYLVHPLSLFIRFHISDHMVFVFLWLVYFT